MEKTTRALLAKPPEGRQPHSKMERWFRDVNNGAASQFVNDWLILRAEGKTPWGVRAVIAHLRTNFDFPFTSQPSFGEWLKRYRS